MNEVCKSDFSILCPASMYRKMGIVDTWAVQPEYIHRAVEVCNSLTNDEINMMSKKARSAYEQGKIEFETNLKGVWKW